MLPANLLDICNVCDLNAYHRITGFVERADARRKWGNDSHDCGRTADVGCSWAQLNFSFDLEWNAIWRAKEMRLANASRSLSLGGHVFTRHFIHEKAPGQHKAPFKCLPGFVFHSAVATCCLNVQFVSRTVWLGKTNYHSQNIGSALWWFPVQERVYRREGRSFYLADGQRWKSANLTGKTEEEENATGYIQSARFVSNLTRNDETRATHCKEEKRDETSGLISALGTYIFYGRAIKEGSLKRDVSRQTQTVICSALQLDFYKRPWCECYSHK